MAKKKADEDISQREPLLLGFYPWHRKQRDFLLEQMSKGRLPHGFLLTGSRYLGKFDFATAFAAVLLCEDNSRNRSQACGECHACHLLKNVTHPDFFLVEPEKEYSAIGIDAIRKLGESMSKTAQRNGKRVAIIYPAENMTSEAANALLKRLEEPGTDVHLLLVTHASDVLLATIRSRCQKLLFNMPARMESLKWLEERLGKNSVNVDLLLEDAFGSPLLALANAADPMYQDRGAIFSSLKSLLTGENTVSLVIHQWSDYTLTTLFAWWYAWLLDVAKLQAGAFSVQLKHQSIIHDLENFAVTLNPDDLLLFTDNLNEMRVKLAAGVPINTEILLESLLIKWSLLAKGR